MLAITATDLPRFMACNGSRLMGGYTPPMTTDNTVKNEGDAADWIISQIFNGVKSENLVENKAPNGVYITADMIEHLKEYIDAVVEPSDFNAIEYVTNYSSTGWQINGRADLVKYHAKTKTLEIGDLKYGWSIVEPENNWTLISHAIGFILNNIDKPVETVWLTIYQPRPHHPNGRVRSISYTYEQLLEFYKKIHQTLSNPNSSLNTSSHCYKCPALAVCPAARSAQMNAIEASENAFIETIDNDNLSFQLNHLERAIKILEQRKSAFEDLAFFRLKEGQIIEGYGLEKEQTNRQWCEFVTPEFIQNFAGIDLSVKKLVTPAQAEKAGLQKEVVAAFTERLTKGLKLVKFSADARAKKLLNKTKGN